MPLHARYSVTLTARRTRTSHGTLLDPPSGPFRTQPARPPIATIAQSSRGVIAPPPAADSVH